MGEIGSSMPVWRTIFHKTGDKPEFTADTVSLSTGLITNVQHYLARFAAFAHVARFASESNEVFTRGTRVVSRTSRGLEVAEILTDSPDHPDGYSDDQGTFAGRILRRMTPQDELLQLRLEKNRAEAIAACSQAIDESNLDVALIDAEQLFDGKSIYFYFLGETSPQLDQITARLAETYESKVQFRKFTDAVNEGCGPGCGTESAGGCSTGGCGSCAIAGSCKTSGTQSVTP